MDKIEAGLRRRESLIREIEALIRLSRVKWILPLEEGRWYTKLLDTDKH
jgi:hypothetical protein